MKIVGIRGGRDGALEQPMIDEGRVILDWGSWSRSADLTDAADREVLRAHAQAADPGRHLGYYANAAGQVLLFRTLATGDYVILPRKNPRVIAIGRVTGSYRHETNREYPNSVPVTWLRTDVPRDSFTQEQRFSLGAFMTFFRLEGKGFEELVPKLAAGTTPPVGGSAGADGTQPVAVDYESLARDEIEAHVISRYKGHGLSRLVAAILEARGYSVKVSPEGPDGGIDVLAGTGGLGLEQPRLAVQVKSGGGEVDIPTYNSLKGAMGSVSAVQGLFVSWAGFKPTVIKANQADWFAIRLWGRTELVDELLAVYDSLDAAARADLPLRRIWVPVVAED